MMKKMQILTPVLAFAALAFVGCSSDDDKGAAPTATRLELTDPAQAALSFPATRQKQTIRISTDAAVSEIRVSQVKASADEASADWCIVKVESASEISVEAYDNNGTAPRTATYAIQAGSLTPVEFTVTQDFPEPENTEMSIDLPNIGTPDYPSYSFTAPATGGDLPVTTVTTTAHQWTAVFCDWNGDPVENEEDLPAYCTIKTSSGVSGESLILSFQPNTTSMMQSGAIVKISSGNAEPFVVYVNQDVPLATSVTVLDANWEEEYQSPHPVAFQKAESGAEAKVEFGVDANGSVEVKIVEAGTSTEVSEPWLESYYGMGSWSVFPTSENTTGSDRSLDVLLTGQNGAELFRLKVTQAGA